MMTMVSSGIYIHIPFCKKKCYYCDFNSYAGQDKIFEIYKETIIREIENRKDSLRGPFSSIYIGGGTPNILPPEYIEEILDVVYKYYNISKDAEISIELNPGLIDENKLKIYRRCHINRVSIGLQAWQDNLLKKIGRLHTINEFIDNYKLTEEYFDNINIDLMYALPEQTFDDWKETLLNTIELKPTHISCYGLILEEGTLFYRLFKSKKIMLHDDEYEMMLFHYAISFLKQNGYTHYEISNYSLPGYECRHNILYWKALHYIGFGPGAYSYIGDMRKGNVKDIKTYIEMINKDGFAFDDIDALDIKDKMAEFMFLGLRMMKGVCDKDFIMRFGKSMFTVYKDSIEKNIELNLLEREGDTIHLTQKGIDISNNVFEDFLL